MSSAIYPDPPRLVTAVCGHGEQQRLSNARLRLTFLLFPGYSLARARVGRIPDQSLESGMPSFERIRYRRHDASVFLYAFDLIELNGDDLRRNPLEVRKATLATVLAGVGHGIWFNDHIEGDGRPCSSTPASSGSEAS